MDGSNFKVIVVGGGPVGLTAAHALDRAGIDFVLLERRSDAVIDAGSNLVLLPEGLRVLSQLGLLDALNSVSSPLGRINRQDHRGRSIGDAHWFVEMKENFGVYPRVISRHDLTKVMYNALSSEAQAKILPNKQLSGITPTADGVVATCADGSSYAGSVIIGADGAHSIVRDLMRTLSLNAGSTETNDDTPFLTTYRCLWVRFPTQSNIAAGTTSETHGPRCATQFFAGEDSAVIGVYERLDKPTRERTRYTMADQEALVQRWGHLPVIPGGKLTLQDVYTSRLEAGLVSLEEGVVDHWSYDSRIVLSGDAAHKFTPSTGAGCNNGMIDIVALVNELHATVEQARATSVNADAAPHKAEIASAFQAYQKLRQGPVTAGCQGASQATATATWQTGIHKFLDRRVLSIHALQKFLIKQGAQSVARTPALDFVPRDEQVVGRVPWISDVQHARSVLVN